MYDIIVQNKMQSLGKRVIMEKKSSQERNRCFATIVYPESAPKDWREKLSSTHIMALVSPLHDRDTYESDQQEKKIKKPHFHIMVYFEGKKSIKQVQEIFDQIGGVGCEIVGSKTGYARYLCHLDDPEKAQYAPTDVRGYGGADFYNWANMDTNPMLFIPEIMDFIERHDIISFYKLSLYCSKYRPEWHKVLATRSTVFFKEYLKSRAWDQTKKDDVYEEVMRWDDQEQKS